MSDKNYTTVYWPKSLSRIKDMVSELLAWIDCNYSKLLHELLLSILTASSVVRSKSKNYRHFEWFIQIRDKETGEVYDCYDKEAVGRDHSTKHQA